MRFPRQDSGYKNKLAAASTLQQCWLAAKAQRKGLDIWVANNRTCTEKQKQKSDGEEKPAQNVASTKPFHHYLITLYKGKKDTGRMVREGGVWSHQNLS